MGGNFAKYISVKSVKNVRWNECTYEQKQKMIHFLPCVSREMSRWYKLRVQLNDISLYPLNVFRSWFIQYLPSLLGECNKITSNCHAFSISILEVTPCWKLHYAFSTFNLVNLLVTPNGELQPRYIAYTKRIRNYEVQEILQHIMEISDLKLHRDLKM